MRAPIVAMVAAGVGVAMAPLVLRADAPPGRYVATGSTVLDTQTGLEWQASVVTGTYGHGDATGYCASLMLNGGGWRLPSITEAATLIDDSRTNPALDPTAFPNTPLDAYWTGSALSGYTGVDAWTISSANGAITFFSTTQLAHVRCVRLANLPDAAADAMADGSADADAPAEN